MTCFTPGNILRKINVALLAVALMFILQSCGASRKASAVKSSSAKDDALISKYEKITGQDIDPAKSLPLYRFVDQWIGAPYKYGCMARNGTDCSGFASILYKEVYQKELPRSSAGQYKAAKRLKKNKLREGDLLFFKIERGQKVSHVGVYLGNNKFVHASTSKGVCISDLGSDYYRKHFRCGGRMP